MRKSAQQSWVAENTQNAVSYKGLGAFVAVVLAYCVPCHVYIHRGNANSVNRALEYRARAWAAINSRHAPDPTTT